MKINFIAVTLLSLLIAVGSWILFKYTRDETKLMPSPSANLESSERYLHPELPSSLELQKIDHETDKTINDFEEENQTQVIQSLIAKIGTRATPLKSFPSLGELAKKSRSDRSDPVGALFPFAKDLIEIGPQAVIPVAKHWAALRDPSSDDYIASLRTLSEMLKQRENIRQLYLELAEKSENQDEKIRYERAASRFAPTATGDAEK